MLRSHGRGFYARSGGIAFADIRVYRGVEFPLANGAFDEHLHIALHLSFEGGVR